MHRPSVAGNLDNVAENEMHLLLFSYMIFDFLQRQLSEIKQSSQLRIQQREKEVQELRKAIFSLSVSADVQHLTVGW